MPLGTLRRKKDHKRVPLEKPLLRQWAFLMPAESETKTFIFPQPANHHAKKVSLSNIQPQIFFLKCASCAIIMS